MCKNLQQFDSTQHFPDLSPEHFIIFVHIQKTAGMTMQQALRRRFGPTLFQRALWRITKDPRLSGSLRQAMEARKMGDRFFAGHVGFGAHQFLPCPSLYMTFVRSPVSRILSLYRYSRAAPNAYYHRQAMQYNLEDFVFKSGLMELDNGQTRMLAGSDGDLFMNRRPVGGVDEEILNRAKHNIRNNFFFVGLQERFNESFLLWARKIGWAAPSYLAVNRRTGARAEMEVSSGLVAKIADYNRYDCELYKYCAIRFEYECEKNLRDIGEQIVELETRNAVYARTVGKVQRFWSLIGSGRAYER